MDIELLFRKALPDDLSDIVKMLADDDLGSKREGRTDEPSQKYIVAFQKIATDPNQELMVVEMNRQKVATFHLSFIQYLTHEGGLRMQVEAVRTASKFRGQGTGKKVFEYIIHRAKEKGCMMIQLTTDKQRPDAIRFYESVGFTSTHEGMKLHMK